jgi:hypothetical protein
MADQPIAPVNPAPAPDLSQAAGPVLSTIAGSPQPAPVPAGRRKELSSVPESPAATTEVPSQPAEIEPAPETSPEMDKFIEKVEEQRVRPPAETVVAQATPQPVPATVTQPVVVLPASQKTLAKGKSKSVAHSVRWLVEWCWRQIRKFKDALVVYRENP